MSVPSPGDSSGRPRGNPCWGWRGGHGRGGKMVLSTRRKELPREGQGTGEVMEEVMPAQKGSQQMLPCHNLSARPHLFQSPRSAHVYKKIILSLLYKCHLCLCLNCSFCLLRGVELKELLMWSPALPERFIWYLIYLHASELSSQTLHSWM